MSIKKKLGLLLSALFFWVSLSELSVNRAAASPRSLGELLFPMEDGGVVSGGGIVLSEDHRTKVGPVYILNPRKLATSWVRASIITYLQWLQDYGIIDRYGQILGSESLCLAPESDSDRSPGYEWLMANRETLASAIVKIDEWFGAEVVTAEEFDCQPTEP